MKDEERRVIRAIQHDMRVRREQEPVDPWDGLIEGPSTVGLYIGLIIFVLIMIAAASQLPWSW